MIHIKTICENLLCLSEISLAFLFYWIGGDDGKRHVGIVGNVVGWLTGKMSNKTFTERDLGFIRTTRDFGVLLKKTVGVFLGH